MAFDPMLSYQPKPKSKSKPPYRRAFGCRRLYVYIALLFIVVTILIFIRLVTQMRTSFENFHFASDTDFELITLPENFAYTREARCLDGSPPAFYYRAGELTSKFWILHLLPGAWCSDDSSCYGRSSTSKGSSRKADTSLTMNGIFSRDCAFNPQFCSWNVAIFLYCDGSSFLGNVSTPRTYKGRQLYMRGAQNFDAILDYLLTTTGLTSAEQVILTGSSAGGTAAIIHADRLRSKLPVSVHSLHVVLDGSMFVDVPDTQGEHKLANYFLSVYNYHGIKDAESIEECTKTLTADKRHTCLFVAVYHSFVFTPIFFINSAFDTWQLRNGLGIACDSDACISPHQSTLYTARDSVDSLARSVTASVKNSVFLSYCPAHCLMYKASYFELRMGQTVMKEALELWLLHNTSRALPSPMTVAQGRQTCIP